MRIMITLSTLCLLLSYAQLPASEKPQKGQSSWTLDSGSYSVKLSHNSLRTIREELLDPTLVRCIGSAIGLTDSVLDTVRVVAEPDRDWMSLSLVSKNKDDFVTLEIALVKYVRARQEGHTKLFMLSAASNRLDQVAIKDAGLRAIANYHPWMPVPVPATWLKLEQTGATTNKARQNLGSTINTKIVNGKPVTQVTVDIPKTDEIRPWSIYTLMDGELGWRYEVQFKADGSVNYVLGDKCDAKDIDPKYKALMEEVEKAVKKEMKKEGSLGEFGSCHQFWQLKKQKLKQKGIDWRSPSDVNPSTNFD